MLGNSKTIISNQSGIHPDLEDVVRRHLNTEFKRPCKSISLSIFNQISEEISRHGGPLILDSGCGTGESTLKLARRFPDCFVVGMDKSELRIKKAEDKPGRQSNSMHVRADLVDVWMLANKAGWKLKHHFLIYPNPWPKKQHLKRRWHAHPVFPHLLALSGELHIRSNWQLYLEEFAFALNIATGQKYAVNSFTPTGPISAFELKYLLSRHKLFELNVQL
jgi:tRNA G46 methylase TrmB